MSYIACTRFNDKTYTENTCYRKRNNEQVIYGSTLKIREKYPIGGLIFVVEMNNDTNKIEGIGLIHNLLVYDKKYKIYDNTEYNRYIYKGKYWLSREQIFIYKPELLEVFDNILFKGKSHLKCRIGITIITEKLFARWEYKICETMYKIKTLFIDYFKNNIIKDCLVKDVINTNTNTNTYSDTEYFDIIPKPKLKRKLKQKQNPNLNPKKQQITN